MAFSSTFEPRYYQIEAVDALPRYWRAKSGNPLVVLPTATGKSSVLAMFCIESILEYPETNILILSHVKELLLQDYQELIGIWPDAPVGIYSSGLKRRDMYKKITIAGIQSVWKQAYKLPRRIDLVIVDEAHTIPDEDGSRYRKFLDDLKAINPYVKVIGLTATPYRMGQGMLTEGENALFSDIAYEYPVLQAVKDGYLCPLVTPAVKTHLDTTGVRSAGGDFNQGQLERAVDIDAITRAAVSEVVELGRDRHCWLVFATGVNHAHHISAEIERYGIRSGVITGTTPHGERDDMIRAHKDGSLRSLVSVGVLTTGYNNRMVDLLAMMRPTQSVGLYIQMVGRAMRIHPDKDNALVLDFAGNVREHGPIDKVRPHRRGPSDGGEAPFRYCLNPECGARCHAAALECPECGTPFPPHELGIEDKPDTSPLLSTEIKPELVDVTAVNYRRHVKRTGEGKPTLRVDYASGMLKAYSEWVCFEHTGRARENACRWWRERAGTVPPSTIEEALQRQGELHCPARIAVRPEGKFHRIVEAYFDG
jgi:DNA repair protein RadD